MLLHHYLPLSSGSMPGCLPTVPVRTEINQFRKRTLISLRSSCSSLRTQVSCVYLTRICISSGVLKHCFTACTMVFDASLWGCLLQGSGQLTDQRIITLRTKVAAASAWLPLLYDTAVMSLTAYKAYQTRSISGYFNSPILQTILAEGMVYYR